jgi:hypothetical protein
MDQLINNINRLEQTPGNRKAEVLDCCFWPEAEDRALRGRNLSAVFRTLYRQVGKPPKGLAFLCTHLAGRELKRKIHLPNPQPRSLTQDALNQKKTFPSHLHKILTKPSNRLSIFSGQPQHPPPPQITRSHVQSHLKILKGPYDHRFRHPSNQIQPDWDQKSYDPTVELSRT